MIMYFYQISWNMFTYFQQRFCWKKTNCISHRSQGKYKTLVISYSITRNHGTNKTFFKWWNNISFFATKYMIFYKFTSHHSSVIAGKNVINNNKNGSLMTRMFLLLICVSFKVGWNKSLPVFGHWKSTFNDQNLGKVWSLNVQHFQWPKFGRWNTFNAFLVFRVIFWISICIFADHLHTTMSLATTYTSS